MKKLFFMALLAIGVCFAACTNKPAAQDDPTGVTEVIENLKTQLEAGDVAQFQGVLETVKEKVAQLLKESPETAKEYLVKVQEFLKKNADKVKAVFGENETVNSAVNSLVAMPAESIIENLQSALGTVKDAGEQAVEDAQDAVETKAAEMKDVVDEAIEEQKQKAADKVNEAADKVNEKVNEAADKVLKGAGLK